MSQFHVKLEKLFSAKETATTKFVLDRFQAFNEAEIYLL